MLQQANTAFLFPGQGSQTLGMGKALSERYRVARQTFEEADDLLGFNISTLCFNGPEEFLNETSNAQPALYAAGIAALRTLYEAWDTNFRPAYVAGHSLGELTALTAAGALSFPDGVRLVQKRGELMRNAGHTNPGGMAALLGLSFEDAEVLCERAMETVGGTLVVANDNCPGQIVIAGNEEPLSHALDHASDLGAKRAVRLAVSIAAHSPLMADAQVIFNEALAETPFNEPQIPIIGNTTARPLKVASEIRSELSAQLTSSVLWTTSMERVVNDGITHALELGSGGTLAGLMKRIDRGVTTYIVDSPEGIDALPR
jgi:[acyl-carrier-protein] S-malonyltransferase